MATAKRKTQAPKGPKYVFEFAQAQIAALPVQVTGSKGLTGFTPEQFTYELQIIATAREDGELVEFVTLPPVQVMHLELADWIADRLPGLLLAKAQEFEDAENEAAA